MTLTPLSLKFDFVTATIPFFEGSHRWLSQLADCFADEQEYQMLLAQCET